MNSLAKSRSLYNIYLADFLKTNLRKFAVICVKRRQKARLLSPRSSKIKLTKKRKGQKEERGEGKEEKEKKQWFLSFYKLHWRWHTLTDWQNSLETIDSAK